MIATAKVFFLTLTFWDCLQQKVPQKKQQSEKFYCRQSQNIKVRKKIPATLKVGEGGDLT